jgi:signal transduction histidine kinase/DNA-binding response OmpR family regulator
MLEDRHGNLWFGTQGGGVSKYDGDSIIHFTTREGLSQNRIRCILEDRHGNLWFGTNSRGVSMFDGKTITHYTEKEGLSDNFVWSIEEDNMGNIWISGQRGISCLIFCKDSVNEPFNNPVIHTYIQQDGLKGSDFVVNSVLLDSKNRIWWGSSKSLTMLDMNTFAFSDERPYMQLDHIEINERFIDYCQPEENTEIKMKFDSVARFYNYPLNLELSYKSNHLTFYFSAVDWSAPHKLLYSFKMDGFSDKWSAPTSEAKANYRNLPSGTYTFKVGAIGAAQIWSEPFEYTFTIRPPLWFTWWAYMIYGFIVLSLILWYRRYLIRREKVIADLRVKEAKMNSLQELGQLKSRFFANISHELRTPLTLIQGPIEELRKNLPDLPVKATNLLNSMKRNAARLHNLIDQILEISKLETGKVQLQVARGNLEEFITTIIVSFLSLAESRKIKYSYELPGASDPVYFDGEKLEKILTNLISNAFKFTPAGGKIKVRLQNIADSSVNIPVYVIIEVADTGMGIPREQVSKIFDRFFQVRDSDSRNIGGTGLGLALTKELVDIYRGEISVESQEGKGSTFTVKLPVAFKLFTKEEITDQVTRPEAQKEYAELPGEQEEPQEIDIAESDGRKPGDETPLILVVEDNTDLRNYISRTLESNFRIITEVNGKSGLARAIECIPDLIISDVMMPVMDGMEMSKMLKTDRRTDHIPIILLTAKADRESKLEGLDIGADNYITKPFDAEELKVRVDNLINQRRKLRDHYRKEFLSDFEDQDIPAPEDDFLVSVLNCIKKHIAEPGFNVEQLSKELRFSRTQLYRKILALTDHSPNEFIRNLRLKMATRMFHQGHRNITRVVYSVGFNTPAYFAQCFREIHGINPSEYIKKLEHK